MKAVILAGGEIEQPRPIPLDRPKYLLPLLGKPLLSHTLRLLRGAGVEHVILALPSHAEGGLWAADIPRGMTLQTHMGGAQAGSAGAVWDLLDELGEDDFWIVPGDCFFSFDLKELAAYHQICRSVATLALVRPPVSGECSLVSADDEGRVAYFAGQSSHSQEAGGLANTGVCLMTRRAAEKAYSHRNWELDRDLFPALLAQGDALSGCTVEGYWKKLRTFGDYLECAAELLSGKGGISPDAPRVSPGVWSRSPIPAGVQVVPPCWFGAGVTFGEGAQIGPLAALEQGASVGRRALVQRAVLLEGARAGDCSTLYGAVLCRQSEAGQGSVLNEGAVLGRGARAGTLSVLGEGVTVWPGKEAPAGARLTHSLLPEASGPQSQCRRGGRRKK